MAYGKFAPKISNRDLQRYGYGGVYGNTYGKTWSDIGYALGAALGNLWGTNYNQRGIEKGEAEGRQALQDAYNKVYGTAQPAPESLQTQYQDVSAKMGIPQGSQTTPQSNDKNTYIDSTKKYLSGKDTRKTMKDQTPQRDIKAEKYDTFMSKYNSGTPNPDGDAQKVDALTQAANGNLANMDFSKLPSMSAEDLQSAIRSELRANGRTDYQINKVLENLSPTIKAKVQEGNNVNFGNLYNTLNQQIKNGELDAANMTFAKMSELNPKMAAALQPKMKRAWDTTALEQNFQNKFNFYKQDPNLTEKQAYNLARYGSVYNPAEQAQFMGVSGRGSRGTGGGSTKGRKSSNDNGDGVQYRWSKYTEADAAAKWAYNILNNDKATPEQRQMATDTLKEVDRFYAKGSYVVPKEEVYSRIKNAIFDGRLTPQTAYDWVFDDSGLGDAEKREIGMWLKDAYADDFNGDYNVSQDDQEYFFGKANGEPKDSTPSKPSNRPLAQNGTLGEWFKEVGETWDKAKAEAKRRKAQ